MGRLLIKKLLLLSILLGAFNLFSDHIVCITTPCEQDHEDTHDNNHDKVLIGAILIVGAYFLFRSKEEVKTEFNGTSGINLYRKRKLEISAFTLDVDNLTYPKNLELNAIKLNLLSFQYQF